jgi:HlyD family secretion protein
MIRNKKIKRRWLLIFWACVSGAFFSACNSAPTIHPVRKTITEAVYASGFVAARNQYKVYALADGYIVKKFHAAGDQVKVGDNLYVVQNQGATAKLSANSSAYNLALKNAKDNSPVLQDLQIKINSAKALLDNDQKTYDRYKNMYNANAISKSQLDQAATNLDVSQNNLRSANESYTKMRDQLTVDAQAAQANMASSGQDLSNYVLKSLTDGMVYETYKEMGEAVRRNDVVALMGEAGDKYLQLAVDQQDIGRIKIGQVVEAKMDIASDKIYKAKVTKIYPNMNSNDQSFRVDADFIDSPGLKFINASVEANIILQTKENALVLPRQAVKAGDMVIVKSATGKKEVRITKGLSNMEDVEILSGVTSQDEVVMPKE